MVTWVPGTAVHTAARLRHASSPVTRDNASAAVPPALSMPLQKCLSGVQTLKESPVATDLIGLLTRAPCVSVSVYHLSVMPVTLTTPAACDVGLEAPTPVPV